MLTEKIKRALGMLDAKTSSCRSLLLSITISLNPIFRKGNVHATAQNILFSWLIFLLSANLRHLRPENNRFFRCLPASDTCVRKRYQILGVNPPLIHSFSNYILHQTNTECNYIFSICGYIIYYSFIRLSCFIARSIL